MSIDTAKLRELAQAAMPRPLGNMATRQQISEHLTAALKARIEFSSQATPETVLALLDEIDSLRTIADTDKAGADHWRAECEKFSIDTCDHGHKFAKLFDHPKKDGLSRCPHCLSIGFDLMCAECEKMRQGGEAVAEERDRCYELVADAQVYPNDPDCKTLNPVLHKIMSQIKSGTTLEDLRKEIQRTSPPVQADACKVPQGMASDMLATVEALQKETDAGWSPDARQLLNRLTASVRMLSAAPEN